MCDHQQLIDEVRRFCDPTTGEVLERIPDEMMQKLRSAKLARGIPVKPSERTGTEATWFVFLNDEIRDRVLAELRKRAAGRKRTRQGKQPPDAPPSASGAPDNSGVPVSRGLKAFRHRKPPPR